MKGLSRVNMFVFLIISLFLVLFVVVQPSGERGEKILLPTFMEKVEHGMVKDVTIQGQQIRGTFVDESSFSTVGPESIEPVYNSLVEKGITPSFEEVQDESIWSPAFADPTCHHGVWFLGLWGIGSCAMSRQVPRKTPRRGRCSGDL